MKIFDKDNTEIYDIAVDDSSVRYRSIMTDDSLTLNFSLTGAIAIPQFSYVNFEGQRYTLWRPGEFKKHNTRNHEYTLMLHGYREFLKFVKYKDTSAKPYRLKFSLTAKPAVFLKQLVDCLNLKDSGWTMGDCIDAPEKTLSFNHEFCIDVLGRMSQEWNTEFEFEGKKVHFRKVEKFKDAPLALSYGKGRGFLPGVGRYNEGDKQPIGSLHVIGGERNIDFSKYGSRSLLLPKSQVLVYDGKTYRTDADGMFITRDGNNLVGEDSYDGAHFYPHRVGTVSEVVVVDADKHFYDIKDASIPETLNYRDCRIAGEKAIIKFESGALAGREFDIEQTETDLTGYIHTERRFKIVPQEIDGVVMPGGAFVPAVGDKYAIFNINLPQAYISDDATQSGASWDMFREAVRYFAENETDKFRFTGELDGVWSKSKWLEIGGKIMPGGHVLFSDEQFQPAGVVIRIVAVKDYVNKPHKPEITLSNAPISGSFSSGLAKLEADEVVIEESKKEAIRFTKRRWRDVKETMEMLEKSLLNFSDGIDPVFVRTMQLIVGDESLQFRFVTSKTNPVPTDHSFTFNQENKQLVTPAGVIQHMTLGITDVSTANAERNYKFWDVAAYTSPALDPEKAYYLYAKCGQTEETGTFMLSESAIAMESVTGYYHLLVGILNSETDGNRSFAPMYGYTEILPGQMRIGKIISPTGKMYIDLENDTIAGRIRFINADGEEEDLRQGVDGKDGADGRTPIKGVDYFDGIDGQDGKSSYTYIRYSQNANGNPMTTNSAGAKYIGIAVTESATPPSSYSSYNWTLVKGTDGIPGEIGADGRTSYLHIKYSNDGGQTFAANNGEELGEWIGMYVDFTQADSNNPADYTWNKIKGEKGADGRTPIKGVDYFDGIDGQDGRSSYTYIRYSQNANGNPMTTNSAGAKYIGIAVTESATPPSSYSSYNWTLVKGTDGIPGEIGADGRTSYLHIKYSNDGGQTFTANNGEELGEWIGMYVDFTQADSNNPADYTWNKIKGEPGEDGAGVLIRYKRSETRPEKPVQTDLDPTGWLATPDKPDNVDIYDIAYAGDWSKQTNGEWKSKTIEHNQKSRVKFMFRTYQDNIAIKITARVSSENGYDKLRIGKIDTEFGENYADELKNISGTKTESLTYTAATKGDHYILFEYSKDVSNSVGDDAGFISIDLPVKTVWITTCAVVGGVGTGWSEPRIYLDERIEDIVAKAYKSAAITDKFGTNIDGGLVSAVMLVLRALNSSKVTAGISGIQGENDSNPAFWSGGTYAQAFALIDFLLKMSQGTTPTPGEYANLASITMLHNGAAKIGAFLVEANGRIVLADPVTGKARLVFNIMDIPAVADLMIGTVFSGSANIGSGNTSTSVLLSGSTNVTKSNASAVFSGATISLNADGKMQSSGMSSHVSATLYVCRNGARYFPIESVFIMFTGAQYELLTDQIVVPQMNFPSIDSGNYTFELVIERSGDILSASASVTSSIFSWEFRQSGVRYFQFGLNGMMAFFSDNHIHFTETNGFDVRGKTNMPGVLAAGSSTSGGGQSSVWGAKSNASGVTPITGGFRVPLKNMEHNQYVVQITPHTATTFRVGTKTTTYFEIFGAGGFDYVVIGKNYA